MQVINTDQSGFSRRIPLSTSRTSHRNRAKPLVDTKLMLSDISCNGWCLFWIRLQPTTYHPENSWHGILKIEYIYIRSDFFQISWIFKFQHQQTVEVEYPSPFWKKNKQQSLKHKRKKITTEKTTTTTHTHSLTFPLNPWLFTLVLPKTTRKTLVFHHDSHGLHRSTRWTNLKKDNKILGLGVDMSFSVKETPNDSNSAPIRRNW